MTVIALLLAGMGIVALVWSTGGHPGSLLTAQAAASAAPSPASRCSDRGRHGHGRPGWHR
jgi:hypothetical protein